ncbi:hypothetical protein COP2_010258 [Malus domestica]
MAPKSHSACESGEGIVTLRRGLNCLHHPQVGLYLPIFFLENGTHSLGPAWTFKVPIVVESNMPTKE